MTLLSREEVTTDTLQKGKQLTLAFLSPSFRKHLSTCHASFTFSSEKKTVIQTRFIIHDLFSNIFTLYSLARNSVWWKYVILSILSILLLKNKNNLRQFYDMNNKDRF